MPSNKKRYAVGYYSLSDNILTIEIVAADSWREALEAHSCTNSHRNDGYYLEASDLNEAKHMAFDLDAGLDVVEIPNA